jgi:hypothetical protein
MTDRQFDGAYYFYRYFGQIGRVAWEKTFGRPRPVAYRSHIAIALRNESTIQPR